MSNIRKVVMQVPNTGWFPPLYALAAVLLAVPFAYMVSILARNLPLRMDRQWRSECSDFLSTPEFKAHPISLMERVVVCLVASGLAIGSVMMFGPTPSAVLAITFCWALLTLAVIDLRSMLLPDALTLSLMWSGLLFALARQKGVFGSDPLGWPLTLEQSVVGAAVGYGSLYVIGTIFRIVCKRDGIGHGDLKLLAAMGAWLGWEVLPQIAFVASCSGLLGAIAGHVGGRDKEFPFGPHLAIAGIMALFAGNGWISEVLVLS